MSRIPVTIEANDPSVLNYATDYTYRLSDTTAFATGRTFELTDTGDNGIDLRGGLEVASIQVVDDFVQIIVQDGPTVNVYDASGFEWFIDGITIDFADFVEDYDGREDFVIGDAPPDDDDDDDDDVDPVDPVDPDTETLELTVGKDNYWGEDSGQDGVDTTFYAPIEQNFLGAVTNTFDSGDRLDGGVGGSTNKLVADITHVVSGTIPVGPSISATTVNVQEVYLRSQTFDFDTGDQFRFSTIDAENMVGVEQWWSQNSRSDIQIEDIRENPSNTAFGMDRTDFGVNYSAYFNARFLETEVVVDVSTFNFEVGQITAGTIDDNLELDNITFDRLEFVHNDTPYSIDGMDVDDVDLRDVDTWDDLAAELQKAFDANEATEDFVITHEGSGLFIVNDPDMGTFEVDPDTTVWVGFSGIDVRNTASIGEPVVVEGPTRTDIILDSAGNGSQGGGLDVGTMSGDRGVEIFDVYVDRDSDIAALASTNLRTGDNYLEEVYVYDRPDGARGDLTIRNMTDVRIVDATQFSGFFTANINLNGFASDLINSYFEEAEDEVQFSYLGGDGGNLFTFDINAALSQDADFRMEIVGGANDDRFNFISVDHDYRFISIDGGGTTFESERGNIVQTNSDINVDAASTPAQFTNIQTLVLGGMTTDANMAAPLSNVSDVVIATGDDDPPTAGGDSTIWNLSAGQSVSIDGKNQQPTGDDNQFFGTITFRDASVATLVVNIDNAARSTGVLTVNQIVVDDSAGVTSAVRTVDLWSNGARNTSNIVQDFVGARVTEINAYGTQDFALHVSNMASAVANSPLTVSGENLEGDFVLAMDGTLLVEDGDDVLTGTGGDNDLLALYGAMNTDADISDFETIQFGWLANTDLDDYFGVAPAPASWGTFDASGTTGVETYVIGNIGAFGNAITLDNLSNNDTVVFGDATGNINQVLGGGGHDITLSGPGGGTLNVTTLEELGSANFGGFTLFVDNFQTINFDLARPADTVGDANLNADLIVDNYDFGGTDEVDNIVRDLIITGGVADPDTDDTLTLLSDIPASVSTIDVSGYNGEVTLTIGDALWDDGTAPPLVSANNDIDFVLPAEEDFTVTLTDPDPLLVDFNSRFEFTGAPAQPDGPGVPAVTWTIDNFIGAQLGGADATNISRLNLSALDIEDFTEIDVLQVGADVVITEDVPAGETSTWQIVLLGTVVGELDNSDNFIYAV